MTNTDSGKEEPTDAFAAFEIYLRMSPASRSLGAVATELQARRDPSLPVTKTLTRRVEKWSAEWSWLNRAMHWDDEQDRVRRQQQQERLKEVTKQQHLDCDLATAVLIGPIQAVANARLTNGMLNSLSDQDVYRCALRAARALPELQARERKLLTPPLRGEGPPVEFLYPSDVSFTMPGYESTGPEDQSVIDGPEPDKNLESDDRSADGEGDRNGEDDRQLDDNEAVGGDWRFPLYARQRHPLTKKEEPQKAFHAFTLFRDLPPGERSLRAVTKRLRDPTAGEVPDNVPSKPRQRRRERVSQTVDQWSSMWNWRERAQAWDDHLSREQRQINAEHARKIREEHFKQIQSARSASRAFFGETVKRRQLGVLFREEPDKQARAASAAIPLLARVQEAEQDLIGDVADVAETQIVPIASRRFTWVQSTCECGHSYETHDQENEDRRLTPCKTASCGCQKFVKAESEEGEVQQGLSWDVPDHLRCSEE